MKPLKQGPTARTEPRPSHPQATHFTTVHRAQRGTLSASRAPVPGSQEVSAGKKRLHVKRASRARWGAAPSPPTTVRDDHTGEALEWWTGWRASPCPTPDLRTLPAVLVPPGTVARRPGDCWVSGACRFSNTAAKVPTLTPPAADTTAQGISSGQGWLTATSSISNSFKEATIHFPTQSSFS